MQKHCIGFDPYEGHCPKKLPDSRGNPFWCRRCDDLRIEAITKSLRDLSTGIGTRR